MEQTPEIIDGQLDPNGYSPSPKKGILTRYGKKLLKEGAAFYKRLPIKDFIDESDEINKNKTSDS